MTAIRSDVCNHDPLLTNGEAAEYLSVSPRTLEKWRVQRCGPAFFKPGGLAYSCVRYRKSDLDAFIGGGVHTNGNVKGADVD